ncbi:uncharacterized protein DFL_006504 [Arthrobotrys flagrans]|uniref:Uncharacterized protein n=1 Tax=Arthrobotrys flagrans TaxID=97331 RepID=A0A437A0I5_ARTFL|nr:hypothetical protein DFL_006504 [Arthrobotrys flagrans]
MASPGYDAAVGGKTGYRFLPFVISEEYGKLLPAKMGLWDRKTRSWVQVLNENLDSSIGVRYAIRNSGIHIMAIQQLERPGYEKPGKPSKPQFGRIASLVFVKPPNAGPILYNVKKVPHDTCRPLDGRCLRLDFRILDGGFVFGVDISEVDTSTSSEFASGAKLALKGMLDARTRVLSFQKDGSSLWLRLETSQILDPKDEPLTVLWSGKSMWLGVDERVLPWIDTDNLGTSSRLAEANLPNSIPETQVSIIPRITNIDSNPKNQPKATPENEISAPDPAPMIPEATSTLQSTFPHLETSLEKVTAFYWEPGIQNWTRIIPETAGTTFSLSLSCQLLSNGIEFSLLHQAPVPQFNPKISGNRVTQVLGIMKWCLGEKITHTMQYHIRMRKDDKGNQLPVFYINLPESFEMKSAEKGGEIFDSMIDVAHQIFLEANHKTQGESYANRWLCIKTSTTQNLAIAMEVLQREGSPYIFCRSTAVPRRSRA